MGKALLLAALLGLAAYAAYVPAPAEASSSVSWDDFETAMNISLGQGKPAMVDFYTDWCSWCKELDKNTYPDARVINRSEQFVCAKVDGDARPDLTAKYNVKSYPTVIFFNPDGTERHRVVGYKGPDEFLKDMDHALGSAPELEQNAQPSIVAFLPLLALPIIATVIALTIYDRYGQKRPEKGNAKHIFHINQGKNGKNQL
jgi:thiol:disulfide interchange protein DsbD